MICANLLIRSRGGVIGEILFGVIQVHGGFPYPFVSFFACRYFGSGLPLFKAKVLRGGVGPVQSAIGAFSRWDCYERMRSPLSLTSGQDARS